MARMPGITWVGEQGSRPMVRHDIVCIHTIVGKAPAHKAHFSTSADGEIFQSRDTDFQSGANVDGNPRVIAIENEDVGPSFGVWDHDDGHAVPDFTDAQVDAIARICAWASATHDIPLVPCPDSRPGSRGIAYHRQGINGNFGPFAFPGRVDGGEVWTTSFGKVCPGDRRIRTLLDRIIPRAVAIAGGGAVPDLRSAQLAQTAIAEAADMLVGQDATTGQIWVISGNTKMKLDPGGGTASGDHHSAGNTGHADVDEVLRMIKESYPGSDPKFVALSNKILSRMPEVAQLVDG
jgi:hypothetical protein